MHTAWLVIEKEGTFRAQVRHLGSIFRKWAAAFFAFCAVVQAWVLSHIEIPESRARALFLNIHLEKRTTLVVDSHARV